VVLSVRRPRARRDDDRGIVAVVVALVVVFVVMPLLALVVDLGLSRAASGQARTTADAAALAAALATASGPEAARAAARSIAADDFGVPDDQWATCVDAHPLPSGTAPSPGDCVSFDFVAKQVRVTLPPRAIPSVFSGVLGARPPAASATSTATWGGFSRTCVLCVLGSYDGGAQQLQVRDGDVAVGGDLTVGPAALLTDSGGSVTAGGHIGDVSGLSTTPGRGSVPADPFAAQLTSLAALPEAAPSAVAKPWPDHVDCHPPTYQDTRPCSADCTPGTYQDVSWCTSFAPGVYVLTGVPLPAPNRPTITLHAGGAGVVFYVTCGTGSWPFSVHPAPCSQQTSLQPRINFEAGGGTLTLRGHAGYAGLALAFDPSAPPSSNTNQRFSGGGTLTVNGSIDGPTVVLRDPSPPNSGRLVVTGGRVVVGAVAYSGLSPTPAHPYLTVLAPAADALPDGPVRLVSSSP
jgi:hypothetical protein